MKLRINIILLEIGLVASVLYNYYFLASLMESLQPVFTSDNLLPNIFMGLVIVIALYKLWCFAKHTQKSNPNRTSPRSAVDTIDADEIPQNSKTLVGSWLLATVLVQVIMSLVAFCYIWSQWNLPYLIHRYLLVAMGLMLLISAILTFFYINEMEKKRA